MRKISVVHVPYNTGWGGELKKGQVLPITAPRTCSLIAFAPEGLFLDRRLL